ARPTTTTNFITAGNITGIRTNATPTTATATFATPTTIVGGQTITIANGPTLTLTATDPTAATGTLTFTANPASSSTEAITGKTYTFVTSVGSTSNQVLISATPSATA